MRVELSAEAQDEVARIDAWWREHRPAAPDLFLNELERGLRTLGDMPAVGRVYESKPGVRRLLLRRTHYHLYFIEQAGCLYVTSVWSAHRGRGPEL